MLPTFLLLFLSLARADEVVDPTCDTHFLDRDRLDTLIQEQKLERITEIVDRAPTCFKRYRIAIHDSSSLQCATPKAPRIILSLGDEEKGNTVCTFNSGNKDDYVEIYKKNPGIDCHENTLECQTFNRSTNRFEYYEIEGSKDDKGQPVHPEEPPEKPFARVSHINPPQCMTACHRGEQTYLGKVDPRPNLDAYPAWPGFYFGLHDKKGMHPTEDALYENVFLPYTKINPRYQAMERLDPNAPVLYNSKPIVNLHNLFSHQNQMRIAAQLTDPEARGKIWPYRYALLVLRPRGA